MEQKHISQSFEPIIHLLKRESTSLKQMNDLLTTSKKCSVDHIEYVINGALVDKIDELISEKEGILLDELYILLKKKIVDIQDRHIDQLIKYMESKNIIHFVDDKIHILRHRVPNFPVVFE